MPDNPDRRAGRGDTVTADRLHRPGPPHDDVAHARANAGHVESRYGPRARPPHGAPAVERLRHFVRRYGWRAYALPVLVVLTVAALLTTTSAAKTGHPAKHAGGGQQAAAKPPPAAGTHIPLKQDDPGAVSDDVIKAAALPAGPPYTKKGAGTFQVLKGTTAKFGRGPLHTYDIEVEKGVTGIDLTAFQKLVDTTLADKRSWSGHGVSLQRVASKPDFRITLASSLTVRKYCGYDIPVETSCYAAAGATDDNDDRVVFNVSRWVRGAPAYLGDLSQYRIYMINHEDGHALGHNHAHQCLPEGLAPAMMQQTFGLRAAKSGQLCGANPWPYPTGAKGEPGAEQQDTAQNNEYGRGD